MGDGLGQVQAALPAAVGVMAQGRHAPAGGVLEVFTGLE
jgi:hypothetical protein